jgi:alkanesulfonate monooxygenase SsuD/methylene tetrahydromethanopterin reductase-like flavin-dependent oxidoreductase (luciferase family)
MRVGIQLPEVEREVRWPEYLAMAKAAEEVGFDSIWVGDHLLYDGPERGPWEVWTLMSALAAATERVTIGPLVACAGFHPPGLIAKMAATIDEVSGGRFVLGLGSGWNRREFDAFGIPYDKRVSRFAEAFTIIRTLLAGERVTLDGQFHRADDAVLLPTPARAVPLMIGSNGPRMLSIAAEHCTSWNTWWEDYGNTPEGFAALQAKIPPHLERSACMLVQLDGQPVERKTDVPAVPEAGFADAIRALGEAGADEVIVVASPITERSIRTLGAALP